MKERTETQSELVCTFNDSGDIAYTVQDMNVSVSSIFTLYKTS